MQRRSLSVAPRGFLFLVGDDHRSGVVGQPGWLGSEEGVGGLVVVFFRAGVMVCYSRGGRACRNESHHARALQRIRDCGTKEDRLKATA